MPQTPKPKPPAPPKPTIQRTVVLNLTAEKWAWLDMIASDRKESMRFVVSSILDLVVTDDHLEEMKRSAA